MATLELGYFSLECCHVPLRHRLCGSWRRSTRGGGSCPGGRPVGERLGRRGDGAPGNVGGDGPAEATFSRFMRCFISLGSALSCNAQPVLRVNAKCKNAIQAKTNAMQCATNCSTIIAKIICYNHYHKMCYNHCFCKNAQHQKFLRSSSNKHWGTMGVH